MTWRCEECGRVSNAVAKPRRHRRRGEWCGPFEATTVGATVVVEAAPAVVPPYVPPVGPFTARQSTLRSFEECARRTWFDIQAGEDSTRGYVEATADLGTILHAFAAEMLWTLRRQDETQISTQEAVEILYEVYERSPIVLPSKEREDMTWLAMRFAERTWRADRLLTVEEQITVPVRCPDGQTRMMTCTPDALFAGGGASIVIADWKSGRGQPKAPREHQEGLPEDTAMGKQYLSDRGHFQADAYSLAALHRYPAAQETIFRELHLRSGQVREARLGRDEMEHVERQLGVHLQKLERGLTEGESSPVWRARPGKWCAKACPVARSCPVPAEQRGMGAIETPDDADREAARYVVVDALRGQLRDGLRSHFEATGHAAEIGDGRAIRWDGGKGGAFAIVEVNGNEQEDRP